MKCPECRRNMDDNHCNFCHTTFTDIPDEMPEEAIEELKNLLKAIAEEMGKAHAIEILNVGLRTTSMTRSQYNDIFKTIQNE